MDGQEHSDDANPLGVPALLAIWTYYLVTVAHFGLWVIAVYGYFKFRGAAEPSDVFEFFGSLVQFFLAAIFWLITVALTGGLMLQVWTAVRLHRRKMGRATVILLTLSVVFDFALSAYTSPWFLVLGMLTLPVILVAGRGTPDTWPTEDPEELP